MESPENGNEILRRSDSDTQVSAKFDVRTRNPRLQISGLRPEASEYAIVWKVYNEESAKADEALSDASHRSIDVLLTFTGLFSTVLTTFIVQAYQFLVQGPPSNMAAMSATKSTPTPMATVIITNTLPQPVNPITPSSAALSMEQLQWVNVLWFASLTFSLCNAAVCMLGKQWLQSGRNDSESSPRSRARQRQRRYMQIKAWHILTVIDALPLFLHVGLLLFFAGLVIPIWAVNHVIAIITGFIVALVYACYLGSMWLSLAHADCPYQHPLCEKLRGLMSGSLSYKSFLSVFTAEQRAFCDIEKDGRNQHKPRNEDRGIDNAPISVVTPEDSLDASALIWLFKHCPNDATTSIALHAIGALPRNFTAFHILRQAGAVSLVLRGFSACFYRDLTLDSQWLMLRPQDAAKYCQAWMRLTCGTSIKWPHEFVNLLETLRKGENKEDISAMAECTRVVASLDGRDGRLMISSYLARHVTHRIHLSQETQSWLLETFLQCSLISRSQFRPTNHIAKEMVPILLHLLHYHLGGEATTSNIRSAMALCLSYTIGGTYHSILLNNESKRQEEFYNLLIPSFTAIVKDPGFFGVDEDLLDQMAADFVHVAIQMSKGDFKDWNRFRPTTQLGLSKLYLQGRINNATSDEALSKVLQIISPPDHVTLEDRPLLLKSLIQTLSRPSQSPVMLGSALRLLESVLYYAHSAVLDTFIESGGSTVLLNVADIHETGSRDLQLSCIRNICLFIQHVTDNLRNNPDATNKTRLNYIFQSPFLHTLKTLLAKRSFWSPEIPVIWVPTLLKLCQVRPYDTEWTSVEVALSTFTHCHDGKYGYNELKRGLDSMRDLINCN